MLDQITSRLRAETGGDFKTVMLAAHQQFPNPENMPALIVVPGNEDAKTQHFSGATVHTVHSQVSLLIGIRSWDDAQGAKRQRALHPLRQKVRQALIGFAPEKCTPMVFVYGLLLALEGNQMWWRDNFTTTYRIA